MTTPEALKLRKAFVDAIGVPAEADFSGLEYRVTKGWDSVAHMQLVGAIESAFNVMLDTDDVVGMSSYKVCLDILRKYGVHVDDA